MPRYRKHIPARFQSQTRSDQGTGTDRGLHHDRYNAQTGNDAIPLREIGRQSGRSKWVLTQKQAAAFDFLKKCHMLTRVHIMETAGHHSDGATTNWGIQAASMCRRVDAQGQTGHHRAPQAADFGSQAQGDAGTGRRGVPTAHDGDRWSVERRQVTCCMQHQRRVWAVEKRCWVSSVGQGDDVMTMVSRQPLARPLRHFCERSDRTEKTSQRQTTQRGLCRGPSRMKNLKRPTEMLQQSARAQPRGGRTAGQGQPGVQFILDLDHREVGQSGTIMGLRHSEQRDTVPQSHHPSVGTGLLRSGACA